MRSNNSSRAAFPLSKFVGIQDENLNSRGSEKTNSRAAVEANYVSALNALRVVDFPLLAQLASHKDASMLDIMGLLRLEDFFVFFSGRRVQRIRGDAAARRLSLSDAMVPLIGPLSAENLTGEAMAYYEVLGAGPSTEVPSSPKIVFEKEELETTLEHTTAP
ncbi:hypothetical protein Tco_1019676 [Tanacetum coccineum]|uniref:Uncharacterized protein n=1 Tax=Tanacetum coccineum TaxID=301880 RepID=A0ABQ5FXT7_9ASTR